MYTPETTLCVKNQRLVTSWHDDKNIFKDAMSVSCEQSCKHSTFKPQLSSKSHSLKYARHIFFDQICFTFNNT